MISLWAIEGYSSSQLKNFSSPGRIIFLYSPWAVLLVGGVIIFLSFCIFGRIMEKKARKVLGLHIYTFLFAAGALAGIILLMNDYYTYGNFGPLEISFRDGLLSKEKLYSWEEIDRAEVSYTVSTENEISVSYDLLFSDGRKVNAVDSPEFFRRAVSLDRILASYGIPVNRSGIDPEDRQLFFSKFGHPGEDPDVDRLAVLAEILGN
ncbi:hypothetical protein ACQCVH_20555 [Bacillus infantis]|uniref:hypothetical protein n=1 Tax=Bacillus infantis TaxID=324767 RepID=UPI003CF7B69B